MIVFLAVDDLELLEVCLSATEHDFHGALFHAAATALAGPAAVLRRLGYLLWYDGRELDAGRAPLRAGALITFSF